MNTETIDLNADNLKTMEDSKFGIELDKIELPEIPKESIYAPIPEKSAETEPEVKASPKKSKTIIIIVGFAMVLIAAALIFLIVLFGSKYGKKPAGAAGGYYKINPIITNIGENRRIKISLIIKNIPEINRQTSIIEPKARDGILMLLASSSARMIINESNSKSLESYLSDEIIDFLKNKFKNKVVMKDIKVY